MSLQWTQVRFSHGPWCCLHSCLTAASLFTAHPTPLPSLTSPPCWSVTLLLRTLQQLPPWHWKTNSILSSALIQIPRFPKTLYLSFSPPGMFKALLVQVSKPRNPSPVKILPPFPSRSHTVFPHAPVCNVLSLSTTTGTMWPSSQTVLVYSWAPISVTLCCMVNNKENIPRSLLYVSIWPLTESAWKACGFLFFF